MIIVKKRIAIIGVGGAGLNTISRIKNKVNTEVIAIDYDGEHLKKTSVDNYILLSGDDASDKESLTKSINDYDTLLLFAGLGGKAGSEILPFVTEFAKKNGIRIVTIVSMPFMFEGNMRTKTACEVKNKILENTDICVVVKNDDLLKKLSKNTSLSDAFSLVDDVLMWIYKHLDNDLIVSNKQIFDEFDFVEKTNLNK